MALSFLFLLCLNGMTVKNIRYTRFFGSLRRRRTTTRTSAAFTIVELLIVIVIIAILAAITIVSYNGIQQRAQTDQQAAALRQYASAYNQYTINNGQYAYGNLSTSSGNFGCIYQATNCYTGWDSALTADLAADMQSYNVSGLKFNNLVLLNYGNPVVGSSYTGQYFYTYFTGSITCPTIGGLRYLSTGTSGSNTICRYGLQALAS